MLALRAGAAALGVPEELPVPWRALRCLQEVQDGTDERLPPKPCEKGETL